MKVAIYDSGVGGLSVYSEIIASYPDANCVFVSDNAAYPYGTKSNDELLSRVMVVAHAICERYAPDVLVLACNTASTVCLPHLRDQLSIPIVGVVPAIKPAAQLSRSKVIGLLATPATVEREYTHSLINEFAAHCSVIKVGSKALVDMAEAKLAGLEVDIKGLESVLRPFIEADELDTLVLACTHFPLLKSEIKHVFDVRKRDVCLVDSGQAIAKRVEFLASDSLESNAPSAGKTAERVNQSRCRASSERVLNQAVFTAPQSSEALLTNLAQLGFSQPQLLEL